MEELLNKIKEKSSEISNQEITFAKELQFLNDLCSKYISTNPTTIFNINDDDIVLALLHIYNLEYDFEFTLELFARIKELMESEKQKSRKTKKKKDNFEDLEEDTTEADNLFILNEINSITNNQTNYKIEETVRQYRNICNYKEMIDVLQKTTGESDASSKAKRLAEKHFKNSFKEKYKISDTMDLIEKRRQELLNTARLESKKNNKKISLYQELIDALKHNDKTPILSFPKKMEEIIDEEIVYEIMLLIHKNNEEKYNKIKEENEKLKSKNTVTQLDECLFEFGVSSNNINKKYTDFILKHVKLDHIRIFIKQFLQMNFSINEIINSKIVYLFKYSTIEQVNQIKRLYDAKMITKDFIIENLGIFVSKESKEFSNLKINPLFENVISNVAILKNMKIDYLSDKFYNPEILLLPTIEMFNNKKMCSKYFKNKQIPKNCYLLANENLFDIIDFCIENELDISIIESIQNINFNRTNITKRILLYKTLGMDYKDKKNKLIKEILTGKNFIVSDDELDLYIVNQTPDYIDEKCSQILNINKRNNYDYFDIITKLDNLYLNEDELSYNFDGVIISKNKVVRNFNTLIENIKEDYNDGELLFQSIIYLTILEENQITKIKNCLSNIIDKNKVKIK